MTSDKKTLNTKFDHLSKIYNCYIPHFPIWESFIKHYSQILEAHVDFLKLCHTLMKFELHFVQIFSNEKMDYIRIVDLDEMNKLGIQNFSIWDNLGFRKLVCRRWNLKIINLNRLNLLKWKVDQNNNCISWGDEQTWYSKLFNFRQCRVPKTSL